MSNLKYNRDLRAIKEQVLECEDFLSYCDVEEFLAGLAHDLGIPFLRLDGPCEDDVEATAPWLLGVFADEDGVPCLAPDSRRHPHDL